MHSETEQQRRLELMRDTSWLVGTLNDIADALQRDGLQEEYKQLCKNLYVVTAHGRLVLEQQEGK